MVKPVLVLNGPNLNLLGVREPDIYGTTTLDDVRTVCETRADTLGLSVDFHQSNHEGELVDLIQQSRSANSGIVINAAAYTHTSVAIMDALKMCGIPVIEVHLSNIYRRETFRHHSYISPVANGVICGFGSKGYELALEAIEQIINA